MTIFGKHDAAWIKEGQTLFQCDPEYRMLEADSIEAARKGRTLTAPSNVAFVVGAWRPATIAEAAVRCHGRLSDTHGVTAWRSWSRARWTRAGCR